MGMCALGDIFQAKVDELISDIYGIKKYINDIIVLNKNSFEKHIGQMRIIFVRMRAAGLKVNAPKCSFGLNYIPYLCYVITREVIKPKPKKVQGIMDIGQPATNNEAQALIGMVHYFMYMWTRRSHTLVLLTESASGPKGRNILWNDALGITFRN